MRTIYARALAGAGVRAEGEGEGEGRDGTGHTGFTKRRWNAPPLPKVGRLLSNDLVTCRLRSNIPPVLDKGHMES